MLRWLLLLVWWGPGAHPSRWETCSRSGGICTMAIVFGLVGTWRPPVPMGDEFPVRGYICDGDSFWFGGNLAPTRPDGRRVPGPKLHVRWLLLMVWWEPGAHPSRWETSSRSEDARGNDDFSLFGGDLAPTRPDGRRVPCPDMHNTIDIALKLGGDPRSSVPTCDVRPDRKCMIR